jgi:hypothetical protein
MMLFGTVILRSRSEMRNYTAIILFPALLDSVDRDITSDMGFAADTARKRGCPRCRGVRSSNV